ncbi:hypothetical protein CBS101457_000391 [Exobasidium rhododendri]|nr:hypothetical protein CBS101457_000391 [Exobasidium rhododendri]
MSSPRHSPPPSAAAPRPKGILKKGSESAGSLPQVAGVGVGAGAEQGRGDPIELDENGNRLAWDESNLTLHEIERETQAARMKIDEPKTPFVRSAALGPMDEDTNFDLDSQGGTSYFPEGSTASESSSGESVARERRVSSAADELAANTIANTGRRTSVAGSTTSSSGGGTQPAATAAVGLDSVEMAATGSGATSRRSDSRSPSFTLPNGRKGSNADGGSREGVREEMRNRDDAMQGLEQDENALDSEPVDPEAKAKQAAFAEKRNAHYGNEAEAMKVAAALAAQEDDDDDDIDEEGDTVNAKSGVPPLTSLSNGRTL